MEANHENHEDRPVRGPRSFPRHVGLVALVAATLLMGLSRSHAQVTLKHQLHENTESTHRVKVTVDQTMTIGGTPRPSKVEQSLTMRTKVGKRGGDGDLSVEHQIKTLKVEMELPGATGPMEFIYDSTRPGVKNTNPQLEILQNLFEAISGLSWTSVYGKDNRVARVEGTEEIFDKLMPQTAALIKGQFDPEYLRNKENDELDVLPGEPIKPGDTWQREVSVRFGGGQTMVFVNEHTYRGVVEQEGRKLHRIDGKTLSVDYSQEEGAMGPARVVGSDLKPDNAVSRVLFDQERGEIALSQANLRITGTLQLKIGDQNMAAALDLKMQTRAELRN